MSVSISGAGSISGLDQGFTVTTGSVGVGTDAPQAPLHLFGSSDILLEIESTDRYSHIDLTDNSSTARITNDGGTGTLRLRADKDNAVSNSNIQFEIDGTERLRISSDGNLGIGSDAPSQKLNVAGNIMLDGGDQFMYLSSVGTGNAGIYVRGNSTGSYLRSHTTSMFTWEVTGTEVVRLNSGGTLLIGKTDTNAQGAGHELRQGTSAQHIMGKTFSGTVNGIYFAHNTSYVGGLNYSNTATSLATSSDYRLKENVVNIPNAIEKAKQLNPVQFNFISDPDETITGFIAHEVGEVVPEACFGEKDAVDEDGAIRPQSVSKANLVPLLAAALKEAISEIETLKTKVAALEGN